MQPKHFHIHTIGCQMNVYDSEQMDGVLSALGYAPALSAFDADLVILNTCSVRSKAEQKAFSFLGRLEEAKRKRPDLIVAVGGCVAQQEGRRILKRAPHVDLIFGTRAVHRLPELLRQVASGHRPLVDLEMSDEAAEWPGRGAVADRQGVSHFVTIMRGCDNYCAYCVVPHVRGPETSRSPEAILSEIEMRVAAGAREIVLLGQNVNSYGAKEGLCTFPQLLKRANAIEGLDRIRFTTSHPKDLTDDLIQAFARLEKLCPHIHLPVQSGSNRVLERMNRRYSREHYLDKVAKLRDSCPGIAITSDMIIGFPGETPDDFKETLDLVREVQFDGLFAFMYSDRPNTPSVIFPDKVPLRDRRERLQILLQLQDRITFSRNRLLEGSSQEVLIEGFSKKHAPGKPMEAFQPQWTGRSPGNKVVHLSGRAGSEAGPSPVGVGRLVAVRIEKALAHSLVGVLDEPLTVAGRPRKEVGHAA